MTLPLVEIARAATTRHGRWLIAGLFGVLAIPAILHFWPHASARAAGASVTVSLESDEPIQPIEPLGHLDASKVDLGRRLFLDARLSHDNQVSCAGCHDLKTGGTDHRVRSVGENGAVGLINAPTVFNSALNFSEFWDGRVPTLEKQVDFPVQSPVEMGSSWPEVVNKLEALPEYVQLFRQTYHDRINSDHIKDALAEFERSLLTPDCRFDRFLRHQPGALNAREQQGYKLFKSFGCASCHQGMNVGGNMFQKFGVMAPYFSDRGHITRADLGRFNVTGDPRDLYMFKVPSLRNVELTAPYFHDGNAPTLPDAVSMMAKYQLGRRLSAEETELIVEFLKTLTGELDGKPL